MTEDELARYTFDFIREFIDDEPGSWTELEEELRRKELCLSCEKYLPIRNVCKECGCNIPSKISEPMESCPLGKWEQHFDSFRKTTFIEITNRINERRAEQSTDQG